MHYAEIKNCDIANGEGVPHGSLVPEKTLRRSLLMKRR